MKRGILYAICFVLTISVSQAVAHGEPDESSDSTKVKPENGKAEKEKKEDKKKGKSFDEVVKDFQAIDGLFRLYHNPEDGRVFLELGASGFTVGAPEMLWWRDGGRGPIRRSGSRLRFCSVGGFCSRVPFV